MEVTEENVNKFDCRIKMIQCEEQREKENKLTVTTGEGQGDNLGKKGKGQVKELV